MVNRYWRNAERGKLDAALDFGVPHTVAEQGIEVCCSSTRPPMSRYLTARDEFTRPSPVLIYPPQTSCFGSYFLGQAVYSDIAETMLRYDFCRRIPQSKNYCAYGLEGISGMHQSMIASRLGKPTSTVFLQLLPPSALSQSGTKQLFQPRGSGSW